MKEKTLREIFADLQWQKSMGCAMVPEEQYFELRDALKNCSFEADNDGDEVIYTNRKAS